MSSVALLGPQYSFSHEFATQKYGDHAHTLCDSFGEALDKVKTRTADKAVIPLENSNASTIKSAQYEIFRRRSNVFVADLGLHHIRLDLYSFSKIAEVTVIRSFPPVFPQTKLWVDKNLPEAKHETDFQSTSDSVLSLHPKENSGCCAAIGSQSASHYNVPVIATDIQTEPNNTLFATIVRVQPLIENADRILIGIENFEDDDAKLLTAALSNQGCAFDSDWVIRFNGEVFSVFEVKALPGFSLVHGFNAATSALKKCFLLGAYSGKDVTRLACQKHSL